MPSDMTARVVRGVNPATGEVLEPSFPCATPDDVDRAVRRAHEAFQTYGRLEGARRGAFLRRVAARLEEQKPAIVARAHAETALPSPRLEGELARTCNQLRLLASVAEEGSWVDARIDTAEPHRQPLPRPDVRSLLRPLGVVGVFGASNFPLAFSVAGGDTASALAAGNTVIVKAHAAHPGTSQLAAEALVAAARECELPEGVFQLLFDDGTEVGRALVLHPQTRAVAFTGSTRGGRALMDLAASRPEPIPVFAEMGSINPVFVLPGAMGERAAQIARGLHASFTLGAGQLCTSPGVTFVPDTPGTETFRSVLRELTEQSAAQTLLTSGMDAAFRAGVRRLTAHAAVQPLAQGRSQDRQVSVQVLEADAEALARDASLREEVFGPCTVVSVYAHMQQLLDFAHHMEGQLTATLHATPEDLREHAVLVQVLEGRVGRLVLNAYPTGVEVCHAMVHGGPYPASSAAHTTSVGTRALTRFTKLMCYQDFPEDALPAELRTANPLGLRRLVNGAWAER